jgi:hypothetical protein
MEHDGGGRAYVRSKVTERIDLVLFTEDPVKAALCTEYWATDPEGSFVQTVKTLGARYDLSPSRVSQTVSSLSEAHSTQIRCEMCGEGIVVRSRQNLLDLHHRPRRQGYECQRCQSAREQARLEAARQLEKDRRLYLEDDLAIREEDPIALDELSLKAAVTLLALIRSPEHFVNEALVPLSRREEPFAPASDYGIDLVKSTFRQGLIAIHPGSPFDAFIWEDDAFTRFYPDRAAWVLRGRGSAEGRTLDLERRLSRAFRESEWPAIWHDEWLDLWMELAIQECIAHLQLCLAEHDFPFAAGPKTIGTYTDLLQTFSIGQVLNFNWRAAKDAAAYWLRADISKHQAANSCIGSIQRQADRARAGAWDVKSFSRPWQTPISSVSHIFFTVAMKVPDMMSEILGSK